MIFSVSNNNIEWSLIFGPDSVTLTAKNFVQKITNCSQEKHLTAWSSLLSQRQEFLNKHLARVPTTPSQEGTMEMRDEVLSSVGAGDLDTNDYQFSDLEDVEFHWENPDVHMNAIS